MKEAGTKERHKRPAFYRLNLIITSINVAIMFIVGIPWWKFINLY